jgi:hypothetical protein
MTITLVLDSPSLFLFLAWKQNRLSGTLDCSSGNPRYVFAEQPPVYTGGPSLFDKKMPSKRHLLPPRGIFYGTTKARLRRTLVATIGSATNSTNES